MGAFLCLLTKSETLGSAAFTKGLYARLKEPSYVFDSLKQLSIYAIMLTSKNFFRLEEPGFFFLRFVITLVMW